MAEVFDRMAAALAGTYTLEREIGRGGMATVYLAHDVRHDRAVALKVLLPELAHAIGPERFQREIMVAASLSHPNILPFFESGAADGLLYYVMPFVEGESLADRLERETQLPLADAIAIAREVAEALAYAHQRGIVHRDIKPANIMLSHGHALVADFGIARAIGDADTRKLTDSGFALGTPAYMSPEQCSGEPLIDGRADIYSLGCVCYEMLIGAPPFPGPSAQVVMARHSVESARAFRHMRPTVPVGLEQVILKTLAKMPADRFRSAGELAAALAPEALAKADAALPRRSSRAGARVAVLVAGAAAVAAVTVVALGKRAAGRVALAPDRVALMPFGTAGSPDEAATGLAGTMPDLLYQRLPAGEGLAAVYPGTVRSLIRERGSDSTAADLSERDALRIAARAGASSALLGRVSRSGTRLVLSATLLDVGDGHELARVEGVEGPPDSAAAMVDRLAALLLLRRAREPAERIDALAAAPLPALRAYLAGQAAFARGSHDAATRHFATALGRDSSLVPAALGFLAAARFSDVPADPVRRLAWSHRDRLSPRDRAYLLASLGPHFPDAPTDSETVRGWEEAVDAMRERADVWYQLGEALFHSGPRLGISGVRERAAAAYRRALAIDSAFAPALLHLVDIAAAVGDTAALPGLRARYLALDSTGELANYVRWRSALDQRAAVFSRFRTEELTAATLERMLSVSELEGLDRSDTDRAAAALRQIVASGAVEVRSSAGAATRARWAGLKLRELALNRGRPAEAETFGRPQSGAMEARDGMLRAVDMLYWGADSSGARDLKTVAAARADQVRGPLPAHLPVWNDVCASGLWHAAEGRLARAVEAAGRLGWARRDTADYQTGYIPVCGALIAAWVSSAQQAPSAVSRLETLETLLRRGPQASAWILAAANLTAARLHEERGDIRRALAAVRRRPWLAEYGEVRILAALSTMLREEGRLAGLAGEREAALGAYRRYLALRADPEPALRPQADSVRAEVARLQAGAR